VSDKRYVRRYNPLRYESFPLSPISSRDGVYVVTGGLGGLGLLSAQVLIELGVKKIVLLSRSGQVSYDGQGLEMMLNGVLESSEADVRVIRCDLCAEESVSTMLKSLRQIDGWTMGIEGIIHCAGILRDALIRGGNAAQGVRDVWDTKAGGAYILHTLTLNDPIKAFICYSSITAALGNIGQTVYGASNAYLDDLIQYRVRQGLPGLSVRWPAVSDVGMAASIGNMEEYSISPAMIRDILKKLMNRFVACNDASSSVVTVIPQKCLEVLGEVSPEGLMGSRKSVIYQLQKVLIRHREDPKGRVPFTTAEKKRNVIRVDDIQYSVSMEVKSLIGVENIPIEGALMDMGLDSLGATELASLYHDV